MRDSEAGDALWEAAGLEDCAEDGSRELTVQLTGGAGGPEDPWTVKTVPNGECPATSFSVIKAVGEVSVPEPEKVPITYEPVDEGD